MFSAEESDRDLVPVVLYLKTEEGIYIRGYLEDRWCNSDSPHMICALLVLPYYEGIELSTDESKSTTGMIILRC